MRFFSKNILNTPSQFLVLTLFLGYSCSTGNNFSAPSVKELSELKELVEQGKLQEQDKEHQPQYWANIYLLGKRYETKGQSEKACPLFKQLSQIKDFPLQQLVKIKTLVNCDTEIKSFKNYWNDNQDKLPSYLEKFYSEHFLKFSEELNLYDLASYFSATLSKYQQSRAGKESYLKQAVTLAEKTKDERIIDETKKLLYEYSPRLRPFVEGEDIYHAGRDFERHRKFSMARSFYRRVINDENMKFEIRVLAYNRYRLSFKQQRKRKEYVNQTLEMIKWLDKESKNKDHGKIARNEYFKTQINYSRAVWTIDQMEKGLITLNTLLAEKDLDDQKKAEAHWIVAAMYLEKKGYESALSHLDQASEKKGLPQDLLERISWDRGWNKYLKEDYNGAIKAFETALDDLEDGSFKNKIRFWLGKTYLKSGNKERAHEIWEEMEDEESFDYYQILTYLNLGKKFKPIAPTNRHIDDIKDLTFRWLMALEEVELSKEYLEHKQKKFDDDDEIIEHLPYYQLAGWYIEGIRSYFSLSTETRKEIKDEAIEYIFPTPFRFEFQKYTSKYDVDPALVYSIARQESAFNQYARSHADAFGLLQLIPEKAKEIARKTSIPFKDHNDLYNVATNIQMGSYLLDELKDSNDENFIAFIASYNAGSSVVRKWLKKRYRKDPIEFIEMIPYKETRNYVKMIFRNYVIYKRLLGFDKTISPNFFWTTELEED